MKLSKIEINAFRAAVNACHGDVWLESPRGDRYNLKSVFSQYIALDALLSQHGDELELYCALREDESNFFKFFMNIPKFYNFNNGDCCNGSNRAFEA